MNERELFEAALDRPPDQRLSFLRSACQGRETLFDRVLRLLEAHEPAQALEPEELGLAPRGPKEQNSDTNREGQPFGRYRILEILGRGGMGVVYRAEDAAADREVALKVIVPEILTPSLYKRFQREAIILSRLSHSRIAKLYEVGVESNGIQPIPYLSMELIPGIPWNEYLSQHRPSLDHQVEILIKIAQALQAAHRQGILHRDIKPSNILVSPTGEPTLVDFGIASLQEGDHALTELTEEGHLIGTLLYMSPERLDPSGSYDVRSDLYSLGVVFYEAISGSPLLKKDSESFEDIITRVTKAPWQRLRSLNRSCHPDLEAIVHKALEKDLSKRYREVGEFLDDLGRFQRRKPVHAKALTPFYRGTKFVVRHRLVFLVSILMAFTLTVGFVQSWAHIEQAKRDTLQAEQSRRQSEQNTEVILSLSRAIDIERLLEDVASFWAPSLDDHAPLAEWIENAEQFLHENDHQGAPRADSFLSEVSQVEQDWYWESFDRLQTSIEQLQNGDTHTPSIRFARERLAAIELREAMLTEFEEEWIEASEWIADEDLSPFYQGLELDPVDRLIPLEPDPETELYEFYLLGSGNPPERGDHDRWILEEDTAIVFVLVPPLEFVMGSSSQESSPVFDAFSRPLEQPPHQVSLSPFFFSKYELTQAQWQRLTGERPSYFKKRAGPTNPVENLTWQEAMTWLSRHGMNLPTEAQWEGAARARTQSPWIVEIQELFRFANLADLCTEEAAIENHQPYERWDDGFIVHAPVGSFDPNPFGLFDILGNVAEWCREPVTAYSVSPAASSGLRSSSSEFRLARGGSYAVTRQNSRVSYRSNQALEVRQRQIGLRPILEWTP